jgi:hypothetical protein
MEGLHKCNQDCCRFSFNCGKVVPNSMMQKRCSFFELRHVHRLRRVSTNDQTLDLPRDAARGVRPARRVSVPTLYRWVPVSSRS